MATADSERTELLVIGAGPGGYPTAIRAAQRGVDVTLVEKDAYGGTCLNYGCIPSKALISTAKLADEVADAEHRGIDASVSTDIERMVEWKAGVVGQLTDGVRTLCQMNGVDLVNGQAEFVDDDEVRITDSAGDETRLQFENSVVATGSRPMALPGFDFADDPVLSSRGALAVDAVPDRLLVVGAGYIGMELSTVFARLGSDVTVVEMLDSALPRYDDAITGIVRDRAEAARIDFHFGEAAQGWTDTGDGIRVETESEDGSVSEYDVDRALVAIGREPVTETLGLEAVDIDVDDRGFIETDQRGQTAVNSVYAVGDVTGEPMLAHAATKEGIVAAETIAGEPYDIDDWIVPSAVFTDPEIATVGMTEAEAKEIGFEPLVGEMPFNASGRAMTLGDTEGFVRLVATGDGGLLGAQIVGPEASELIGELTFAIKHRHSLEDVARTIHVHPTLSEAVMEAAENALGQAIHTAN